MEMTQEDWWGILQKDFSFLTRLAYADWLEEHGEETKAQGWRHMTENKKEPYKSLRRSTNTDIWIWFTTNGHRCGYAMDTCLTAKTIKPYRVPIQLLRRINGSTKRIYKREKTQISKGQYVAVEFYNRIDAEEAYVEAFQEMIQCKKRNG